MQRVLQAQSGLPLLRRFLLAALTLVTMACASSKTMTPSKPRPSQSMICWIRLALSPFACVRRVACVSAWKIDPGMGVIGVQF